MSVNDKRALELLKIGLVEEAAIAARSRRTRLSWHTNPRTDYSSYISSGGIAKHFGYSKLAHQDFYVYIEYTEDANGDPIAIIRPGGERDSL